MSLFSFHSPRRILTDLAVVLTLGASLSACASFSSKEKGDPIKMSKSEASLAADLWQRLGRTREALDHGLRAVEYDEENADAAHLVALLYLDFCRTSQIGECHLQEAEKHARNAIAHRENFLEAQNTLAVVLIHRKKYPEAAQLLVPITENILYGTPEVAWGNLGWVYIEMGKNKEAIRALRRAVAAQPLFCVGSFRLGVAYHRSGALESSLEALDRALETDAAGCNKLQDAFFERAQVQVALGAQEDARSDLDRCIELAKTSDTGRRCESLLGSLD